MTEESVGDGTVGKALDVLDRVAAYGHPVRFSDLLVNSPYPKATLYRFLQTLTNQGMLAFDEDRGTYAMGVRLVRLAHAAWAQSSLAPIARPWIDTLSAEVAADGIRVNAIAPGWIDTPMFHKATDGDPQRLGKILGRIPAKMVGDPMDIGMVTAFLCSDAARYISGSCIPVDGGALIGF